MDACFLSKFFLDFLLKIVNITIVVDSTGFDFVNILRLAAYKHARRALRRECEPDSAQSAEQVQHSVGVIKK